MGKFLKEIRYGRVRSPFRIDFDLREWIEKGASIADDIRDEELRLSGVLLADKLQRIWRRFGELQLSRYSGRSLRRAYVGFVNRDFATLIGKMQAKVLEYAEQDSRYLEEMLSTKVGGARNGHEYAIDDLAAAGIDGLQMPLRKTFEQSGNETRLELKEVIIGGQLGQMHWFTSTVWDDCIWSGGKLIRKGDLVAFIPAKTDVEISRAIGYQRSVKLSSEARFHGAHIWRCFSDEKRAFINRHRRVVRLSGKGRRLKLEARAAELNPRIPIASFEIRTMATELYFEEIFQIELPNVKGVTLDLLLSAWELLHSLCEGFAEDLPKESQIDRINQIFEFAPEIPRAKICELLADTLDIPFFVAGSIIDFLTFTGQPADELWAKPLVRLDSSTITPVLTCLISPNPIRMVEKWMKNGGIDLRTRGGAFETYARAYCQRALEHSKYLKNAGVCGHGYKLKLGKDDPGDIDLIIWFGNTILIGEVKCNLFPTRASEFYNYFADLEKAGQQITRKADAFKAQTDKFWATITKSEPPPETKIVPFILTNLNFGVGLKFNGVPVTDREIIGRYLSDGGLDRFVSFSQESGFSEGQVLNFYASASEAEEVIDSYLADPPQLQHFQNGLRIAENELPMLDDSDSPWLILDYEVEIKAEALEAFRITEENSASVEDAI